MSLQQGTRVSVCPFPFLKTVLFSVLFFSSLSVILEDAVWAQGFGAGRDESQFRSRRGRDSRQTSRRSEEFEEGVPATNYEAPAEPEQQEPAPESPPPPVPRPQLPPAAVPQPGVPGAPRPLPPGVRPVVPGQPPVPGQPGEGQEVPAGIPPQGDIVLRLAPLQQKVEVDEIVPLHVWLDNPLKKEFNIVSFALSYDPDVLEFIDAPGGQPEKLTAYDNSEKTVSSFGFVRDPEADPFYLNEADKENGMVYYRARCASGEVLVSQGFILSMKFRVIAPKDRSPIKFLFSEWPEILVPPTHTQQEWQWPSTMTFVGFAQSKPGESPTFKNVLGGEGDSTDGVISGGLTVQVKDKETLMEIRTQVPEGPLRTRLVLDPPMHAAEQGKTFDLNVRLGNPDQVPWDRIRLDIRFDPRYLEVVDQDEGNWMTIGTNILDGPFHNRFPFDWMRENLVRQNEGRILYENGVFREPFKKEGSLATIQFRALETTPQTPVFFYLDASPSSRSGTRLTYQRSDVLGDTENPKDGTIGATLAIVPARDLTAADIDPVR